MLARITGTVLNRTIRAGEARATKNPYELHQYTILVQNTDVAVVTVNALADGPRVRFDLMEWVDLLVEVGVYREEARADYRAEWVDVEPLSLASPAA